MESSSEKDPDKTASKEALFGVIAGIFSLPLMILTLFIVYVLISFFTPSCMYYGEIPGYINCIQINIFPQSCSYDGTSYMCRTVISNEFILFGYALYGIFILSFSLIPALVLTSALKKKKKKFIICYPIGLAAAISICSILFGNLRVT